MVFDCTYLCSVLRSELCSIKQTVPKKVKPRPLGLHPFQPGGTNASAKSHMKLYLFHSCNIFCHVHEMCLISQFYPVLDSSILALGRYARSSRVALFPALSVRNHLFAIKQAQQLESLLLMA